MCSASFSPPHEPSLVTASSAPETEFRRNSKPLAPDNSFALTIWCERYLGKYYNEIYDIYKKADYLENEKKIYILTKPNVPFIQDGLRDGEHIRDWMYNKFLEEFKNKNIKYYIIDSHNYDERFKQAIKIIEDNLKIL